MLRLHYHKWVQTFYFILVTIYIYIVFNITFLRRCLSGQVRLLLFPFHLRFLTLDILFGPVRDSNVNIQFG